MNYWKQVWDAYHGGATKRAYAKELWRLSRWGTRVSLCASILLLVWGIAQLPHQPRQELPWPFVCGELFLLAVIQHMKTATFRRAYGSASDGLVPSDDSDNQVGRFLMFKRHLVQAGLTKSHVQDLFDLLDAREGMEVQRNTLLNRFWLFISGFFSALAITLIRGMSMSSAISSLFGLIVASAVIGPVLWFLPSRRERLKELRYFMLLYCKGLSD